MEPNLVTDPRLEPVLRELMEREPIFHTPAFERTRAGLEKVTAPEFWEVGASGRCYGREHVIDGVEKRGEVPEEKDWETRGFHCLEIAPDNYLLTYTLAQAA